MEGDIRRAFQRAERGSKIKPEVDRSHMSAQASRAGRDFSDKFTSSSKSGMSAGGMGAGKMFLAGFGGAASAAALAGLAQAAAGAYVSAFQSVMETGLDFSRTLNNFKGVTRATAAEMTQIKDAARALGADTTLAGASSSDAAVAMTELAKAGFSVNDAMRAARGTLELSTAGQIDAAKAAEIQSNAMNAFGLQAGDAAHVADLLANAAIASSADIPDIGQALQQVGGVAHGFGENLDDTVAALALFANAGIKGSDAGTLLKTTMQSITDQGNPAQGAIEALGLELYRLDASGDQVFVGFRELFRQLDEAKKSMSSQDFQAQANILFGSDAMRAAMLGNADAFDVMLEKMQRTGSASEMAKTQMEGLPGAVESFQNTVESVKLTAFEALGPTVQNTLNDITGSMDTNGPEIVKFFVAITNAGLETAQFMVRFTGVFLETVGQIAGGVGNVMGAVAKFQAWQADLRGDKETADELRKQAEEFFSLGEGVKQAGQNAQRFDVSKLTDGLSAAASQASNAKTKVAEFSAAITDANGKRLFGPPMPDTGTIMGRGPASPRSGASGSITSGEAARLGGASINTSILRSLRGSNPIAKLTSGMTDHSRDSGEHPKGKAIDVDPSRENLAWAWANRDQLSMIIYDDPKYVWYNMHGERAEGAAARKIYGESTMAKHRNHIHIAALSEVGGRTAGNLSALLDLSGGATGGQKVPDWDAIAQKESGGRWNLPFGDRDSTGGLQIRQGTWLDFGGQQYAPTPGQATKEQQIAVAEKILAKQGPQAWAGGKNFVWKTQAGTGAPSGARDEMAAVLAGQGYFEAPDPRDIREATEKLADRENALAIQEQQLRELRLDAKQSEVMQAEAEVARARRERDDAKADLDETLRGKFKEVDEARETALASGGGGGDASSFGSSLVSGMLQAVGLGDVFSNPLEWPNVKSAFALANWGAGMLRGLAGGGAQGPGGATTSLAGGGGASIPGIQLPNVTDFLRPITGGPAVDTTGMAAHGAGGGQPPGPGPSYVINGNVGMDPRDITQRFDAAHNQAWRRNMPAVRPGG